jgi:hypothetical protein
MWCKLPEAPIELFYDDLAILSPERILLAFCRASCMRSSLAKCKSGKKVLVWVHVHNAFA